MIEILPSDIAALAPEFATFLTEVTEVQGLSFDHTPDDGDYKLAYEGVETAAIAFDASDDDIQTALRLIPGLEEVTVLGDATNGFYITFTGVNGNLALLVVTDSTLTYTPDATPIEIEVEVGVVTNGHYPDNIDDVIELAREFVCESSWGTEAKAKKAICLMTAHLLKDLGFGTGNAGSPSVSGPITSERVGDLSRTYAQMSFSSGSASEQMLTTTKYGKTFLMLRKTLVTTPIVV